MTLIGGGPLLVAANSQSALRYFDENFGSKITGSQDFESCWASPLAPSAARRVAAVLTVQCSARLARQVRAEQFSSSNWLLLFFFLQT